MPRTPRLPRRPHEPLRGTSIAALLLFHLSGCALLGPTSVCPARGGPPWRELHTAHFVVRTDAGERAAQYLLAEMETTYAALVDVAFVEAKSAPPPMNVVLLAQDREPEELIPSGFVGVFERLPNDIESESMLVLPAELDERGRVLFAHACDDPRRRGPVDRSAHRGSGALQRSRGAGTACEPGKMTLEVVLA
jgi:hypothetical protein